MESQVLAEHIYVVISILAFLYPVGVFFWRIFTRLETKMDKLLECFGEFPKEYVSRGEGDEVWETINRHTHNSLGRVVRL